MHKFHSSVHPTESWHSGWRDEQLRPHASHHRTEGGAGGLLAQKCVLLSLRAHCPTRGVMTKFVLASLGISPAQGPLSHVIPGSLSHLHCSLFSLALPIPCFPLSFPSSSTSTPANLSLNVASNFHPNENQLLPQRYPHIPNRRLFGTRWRGGEGWSAHAAETMSPNPGCSHKNRDSLVSPCPTRVGGALLCVCSCTRALRSGAASETSPIPWQRGNRYVDGHELALEASTQGSMSLVFTFHVTYTAEPPTNQVPFRRGTKYCEQ